MIGPRSTIGLALLCAFAFCALAAQGAVAQVGDKSVNTTAVTCVKDGGAEDFSDAHCDTKVPNGTGDYGHVSIANDTTTELEVTSDKTKNNTTEATVSKLNATLAGVNTEVTCNTVKSVAGKSFLHNVETSGKHTVTGTVQVTFSNCTVVKPSKCIVTDIVLTAEVVGVEGLNAKGEMGVEFVGEGANKQIAEIIFHHKPGQVCSLDNTTKPFVITGSAIATGKVAQGNKHSGATWVFEDANEMETLEVGLKKASLAATVTPSMASGGNPIALTTVT